MMNQMQSLFSMNHQSNHIDSMALNGEVDSEELAALQNTTYLSAIFSTAKLRIFISNTATLYCIACKTIGDWDGHLIAVGKLLNYFAATGHISYAKCGIST